MDSSDGDDDDGISFFNPELFTSNVEVECEEFVFGEKYKVQLKFVHGSNQFLEQFVSRVVWPSAEALCGYFSARPELVEGKRVLELGSGTGLCGIMMALLGADKVVMTDYNDPALELIKENIEDNNVAHICSCTNLQWGDKSDIEELISKNGNKGFDLVLGTDVVYEPECIEPLLLSAKSLLSPSGQFYLANHKDRYALYESKVQEEAVKLDFRERIMEPIIGNDGQVNWSIFVPS